MLTLLLIACRPTVEVGSTLPSFTLEDVNPASATYGQDVSPRAERGRVSAWYFGHST